MAMLTARPRRSFTPAFKAQTVELVRTSGKSVAEVCRELELTETAVRRWMARADIDAGRRDGLTTAEREELSRLRRENRVLREERDSLKKAAACFAKETTRWAASGSSRRSRPIIRSLSCVEYCRWRPAATTPGGAASHPVAPGPTRP